MNVFDNEAFEASGMSIAELAKAARVNYQTAWRWTSGRHKPSPMGIDRLVSIGLWIGIDPKKKADE
jgi:transcriptional regulator with XRE-family HTH domain